jgi:hypothetical protein
MPEGIDKGICEGTGGNEGTGKESTQWQESDFNRNKK